MCRDIMIYQSRQGFTAVNKPNNSLAWSGEGYKSSLGKKLTNFRTHHISSLKTSIRGWEFLPRHNQKVLWLETSAKMYLTVLHIALLTT